MVFGKIFEAFKSNGFSASMTIDEVYANPDILWETIADVNGMKSLSPHLQSIALKKHIRDDFDYETHNFRSNKIDNSSVASEASGDTDIKSKEKDVSDNAMGKFMMTEGMAWEEVRKVGKHEVKLLKRVTSIETTRVDVTDRSGKYIEQHELRSVRIHVKFLTSDKQLNDAAKTISFTVDSIVTPASTKNQMNGFTGDDGESLCENDNETINTVSTGKKSQTTSSSSSSISIVPCRLISSMAFVPPPRFRIPCSIYCHKKNFYQKHRPSFMNELAKLAKAAEEMQQQITQQDSLTMMEQ